MNEPTQTEPALAASVGSLRKYLNPVARPGFKGAMVTLASSLAAIVLAFVICGVLLLITGESPFKAYGKIIELRFTSDGLLDTIDRATPMIIAAIAVALGFRMNLFNIGVEGQFLVGAFGAAVIASRFSIPPVLHVASVIVVAMVFGGLWGSIAAFLKVKRGVSEVISTIMLNMIALQVIDWAFQSWFKFDKGDGALDVRTKPLPTTAWMPFLVKDKLGSFILVSLFVAFAYWVLVYKSQFGFRLRASGMNATAARTAGISSNRMIVRAMLLSAGVAGLAGLPSLLGVAHAYSPVSGVQGYGFKGIGVALLGRHHPVGIVAAAMLYGFLDGASGPLQLEKIPSAIVQVIQAIILLTVVIVNEAVAQWMNRRTAERASAELKISAVAA